MRCLLLCVLHDWVYTCRELLPTLCQQLVPFALMHGGVRLSVGVMSHVCYGVLGRNPQLLRELLPHITHMAAFSLFSDSVTQAAALQQQKCDVALLLPSRVVLCGFLVQLARWEGHKPAWRGKSQTSTTLSYNYLHA